MKKNSLIYLVLGVITIYIFGYLFVSSKKMPKSESLAQISPKTTDTATSSGAISEYVPYNNQDFESKKFKRRVLFFYANWCTTCRPVNAEFQVSANQLPVDVVVYRVNYNDSDTDESERALAEKYKIIYQHTFVQINEQGEVIKKWNGGNLADLIKNVN